MTEEEVERAHDRALDQARDELETPEDVRASLRMWWTVAIVVAAGYAILLGVVLS